MGRLRHLLYVVGLSLATGAVSSMPAAAQTDTGEIDVSVIDAQTSKPIGNARVILVGPQTASSLTTNAGSIKYTDVPIGIYRVRVLKSGFRSGVSTEFDVLSGRAVDVRVSLALQTGGLKVIGRVTATSKVSISSEDIDANSAIRRLSDSLTDALDKLAGVSINSASSDPDAAVTISLHNHDESQTGVTLDGVPLSAPGSAADLSQISSDLFTGSSVSFAPSAGALGGTVNFRTLQPTQALLEHLTGTDGTFDRANYSIAATGSAGDLGIAVQHTWRGSNNPLTFQDFEDQSGLTYPHEGERTQLGDFFKLRYTLGDERTVVSATALTSNTDTQSLCTQYVTLYPCGYGPGNSSFNRYAFAYGTVQSLVGTVATSFTAYSSANVQNHDLTDRYLLEPANPLDPSAGDYVPTLDPALSTTLTNTRGVAYSASISQGRHTFTLSGNTYASLTSSIPKIGSIYETAYSDDVSAAANQFGDSYKASDKVTLSGRLSLADATGVGLGFLWGAGVTYQPDASDALTTSVNAGSSQPATSVNRSFSDPQSAQFNCAADSAVVSGPGDTGGGAQSAFDLDSAWTHQFRSGASVSLDGYTQVQTGQLINAQIEESAGYFPFGYTALVNQQYHATTVCGGPIDQAPQIFVNEPVGGTRRIYQGFDLTGRFGLGRYVVVLPVYSLSIAELTAAGPRLDDGPSTTIVGAQLPGRPMHRGGITLDGLLPASQTELLANAQYTGSNNNQHIGNYVVVSAGIAHRLGPGTVTLFETNMFDTYAGAFATDANAVPLPLSSGGSLRSAGLPLTPRSIFATYAVNIGGPPPPPSLNPVRGSGGARGAQTVAQAQPTPAASPGASRGGGLAGRLEAVPPPPGTDPLSLATARPACDAQAQAAAQPVLAALRAYVTAYEAKGPLPEVALFTITPHVASGADGQVPYFLELRPKLGQGGAGGPRSGAGAGGLGGSRSAQGGSEPGEGPPGSGVGPPGPGGVVGNAAPPTAAMLQQRQAFQNSPEFKAFRAFSSCTYVTALATADAKAKGIVVEGRRAGLLYVPGVGLVYVRPPTLPQGGGSLKSTQ
jgi:hypothetical protein